MLDRLDGREAVLAAAGHHPYARLMATGDVTGYRGEDLLGWVGTGPWGPLVCTMGSADAALAFVAGRRATTAAGTVDGARWLHLPRIDATRAAGVLPVARHDDWDFRWTAATPPDAAGEERAGPLDATDDAAIGALLNTAFPDTTSRPGDSRVRRWYGIRDGDRLVATGADRSRGGVGFIAGLAVHPGYRRRGLGAALTAAMTRALHREFGVVALGVMADDGPAGRMYDRLGYAGALARTSVALP